MALYLGDFTEDALLMFFWSTNAADGSAVNPTDNGAIAVVRTDLTTWSAGIGLTWGGLATGLHGVMIDLSTDPFYQAGDNYAVYWTGGIVDGQSVNAVLAMFSIENRFVDKTGHKLASDGLDTVVTTEPSGVAANFREMMVQMWRRFLGKVTMSSTELKTYKDDDSVATTQAVSDDGTTQTQGKAS